MTIEKLLDGIFSIVMERRIGMIMIALIVCAIVALRVALFEIVIGLSILLMVMWTLHNVFGII